MTGDALFPEKVREAPGGEEESRLQVCEVITWFVCMRCRR